MKKIMRVFALVIGVSLVVVLCYLYIGFEGNPIIKWKASRAFDEYLSTHYTELSYEKEAISFNFKDGSYRMMLDVKDSEDRDFPLFYREGVVESGYDMYVVERFNMDNRFAIYLNHCFLNDVATDLFSQNLNFISISHNQEAWKQNPPTYDTPNEVLLKTYPLDIVVYLHDKHDFTLQELKQKEEELKKACKEAEITLSSFSIK